MSVALWGFFLLLTALLGTGCPPRTPGYDPVLMAQIREKIHEIKPLTLEEADPNRVVPEVEPPPAALELSLEQSRILALENNLGLKASLISPTIAAARLRQEEAKFESVFYANVGFDSIENPAVGFADEITGAQRDQFRTNVGVEMPLRTGGIVRFDLADSRTETDAIGTRFNPYYFAGLTASISHPLLRNAGRWVNAYSILIATYDRDIVDARTRLDIIVLLAAVDRVYWRLYAARRELEVRQQQYELSQAQLEQVRRLVEGGQRAQVEIIRAEAGVAQRLEAILIAENNLRDRERELKRVMNKAGLGVQTPTILVPATEPDPVRYDLDYSRLIDTAMAGRMELLELQLQLLQDAGTVDFFRNQTLPLAMVDYSYNISGLGEARGDAFDMLFDNDFASHRVGLRLNVPLGNQVARNRLLQAVYTRRQRLATRANREDLIRMEVLNAADRIETNWQRILAARQNSVLNARLYEAERRQFEVGMRTSTEVLDAQTRFADAQSAEIRALAEYQIALVDLAYATGTILGAAKIQWEPIVPETGLN